MTVPFTARVRLAEPLREWAYIVSTYSLARSSSLPLSERTALEYRDTFVARDREMRAISIRVGSAAPSVGGKTFNLVRTRVLELVQALDALQGTARALAPFSSFGTGWASDCVTLLMTHACRMASALERGEQIDDVAALPQPFGRPQNPVPSAAAKAFDLDHDPVDDVGEFAAGHVYERYPYQRSALLSRLVPLLDSLGIPYVNDPLAMISIAGKILTSPDPVFANRSMTEMLNVLLDPPNKKTLKAFLIDFHSGEAASLQGRRRTLIHLKEARTAARQDDRAHAQAEAYRRVIEGPVRHLGWAAHRLRSSQWEPAPRLWEMTAAVDRDGGWLAFFVDITVIRSFRNGQAHETLEWSHERNSYAVGAESITFEEVTDHVHRALAFSAGAEAAILFAKAHTAAKEGRLSQLPSLGYDVMDPDALAGAVFGANRLGLLRLHRSRRVIRAVVREIAFETINPGLQALLHLRRSNPGFDQYELSTGDQGIAEISVSADALDRTETPWQFALARFPEMPLSTFLPVNLAARLHDEDPRTAAQSARWIAIDDLLDAIVSSENWATDMKRPRLQDRFTLVSLALLGSIADVCEQERDMHNRVAKVVRALGDVISKTTSQTMLSDLNRCEPHLQLREWHESWGPVTRLPRITKRN